MWNWDVWLMLCFSNECVKKRVWKRQYLCTNLFLYEFICVLVWDVSSLHCLTVWETDKLQWIVEDFINKVSGFISLFFDDIHVLSNVTASHGLFAGYIRYKNVEFAYIIPQSTKPHQLFTFIDTTSQICYFIWLILV